MSKEYYDWLVKVIVLGDSGVGKTNILTKYCDDKFSASYTATIGVDFKIKTIQVDDKKLKLQIWDTAGQERFRNITQTYYKGAFGIIFVYSIIDRLSFGNVEGWIKSIKEYNMHQEVCSVLVGNKCDSNDRRVSKEEGEALARLHEIPFIETSALEGTNISKIFELLGQSLKKKLDNQDNNIPGPGVPLDPNTKPLDPGKQSCNC